MTEQDQGGRDVVEAVFSSLLVKCDEDPEYALAVFSAVVVLIQHLASGLPVAERQARAVQLYKLADEFAAGERA